MSWCTRDSHKVVLGGFDSHPRYAEIQHNDVGAVEIRRETLRAHSVVYGEHIQDRKVGR